MKLLDKHPVFASTLLLSGVLLAFVLAIGFLKTQVAVGSVTVSSEYQATTTSTGRFAAEQQLISKNGTLGSVVVTGSQSGVINLYDATTSDITQRASSMSTSSIWVANLPANAATSTYTFDLSLKNGLWVSVVGSMPTTTITFRN